MTFPLVISITTQFVGFIDFGQLTVCCECCDDFSQLSHGQAAFQAPLDIPFKLIGGYDFIRPLDAKFIEKVFGGVVFIDASTRNVIECTLIV